MDIILLKRHLVEYQTFVNKKNKTIGSIIRHHRRQQRITLEETSTGICSISYLCKVENNQIVPSDKILPQLIERLNIREEEFHYNETSNWSEEILSLGYVSDKLLDQFNHKNTYQAKLIKFGYTVLNENDYKGSYQQYLELTDYFPHFLENELFFFIYLVMYIFYKTERYYDAMALYKEIDLSTTHSWLAVNASVILNKCLYKLHLVNHINLNYPLIVQQLIDCNNLKALSEIRNYNLTFKAKILETEELDSFLSHIIIDEEHTLEFIWFNHYFYKMKNYEKALTYIREIYSKNDYYYTMYLITLDITKKEAELTRVLESASKELNKESYKLVENYLKVKYFNKNHLKYLKEQLIKSNIMSEEIIVSDYLLNESHKLFKSGYYYKDAVVILERQNRILREKLKFFL